MHWSCRRPLTGTLDGTTHTDDGIYSDSWTFTGTSGNYTASGGPVNDVIWTCIPSTVTVDCDPASFPGRFSPNPMHSHGNRHQAVESGSPEWITTSIPDVGIASAAVKLRWGSQP